MASRELTRNSQAVAILFIVVMVVGFATATIALARWESPAADTSTTTGLSLAPLVDGSISERAEAELESGIPVRTVALRVTATLKYLLFRTGNDGVVVGRDGWLYTREEFEHHPSDVAVLTSRLEFIGDVSDALADVGVELLVTIIPSKARIVTEPLPARWANLGLHPRYDTALDWLATRGIATIDIQNVLGSIPDPFLRADTHWTPSGAREVAAAIAAAVSELGVGTAAPPTLYETRAAEPIEVAGDLISFIPVGPLAPLLGLGPQSIRTTETIQTSVPSLGLFDTPQIPVTLIGTSFSADERWNFIGELKRELGMDVLNISAEAVGPFVPMVDYLTGPALAEVRPELVVWEIPERYLTLPDVQVPEL